ncbi:type II toxin-antitoxin system PemK/MazF family toxin [bacterium]|nr:type II toxin-antitoxin system PemK/MazF family toxin [bacterium]
MARILRGDIWWADLDPVKGHEQARKRPVLIISHGIFNNRSGTIIALAITSQEPRAGFPLTYRIDSAGMPKASWVKMSQVRTISIERLGRRIGNVSGDELDEIVGGFLELIA